MDCQAFVERCMRKLGVDLNLAGSNAWYRKMTWVGTPEECKRKYGSIPLGAFLFILKQDGNEPAKYRGDGVGNASHIGLKTGRTANEMCKGSSADVKKRVSHGDGAINSSSTWACVATSKFADKSINGGWNRVGLWDAFDYGDHINDLLVNKKGEVVPMETMTVMCLSGNTVRLRESPRKNAPILASVRKGTTVMAGPEEGGWRPVQYGSHSGWMMAEFLVAGTPAETDTSSDTVNVQLPADVWETVRDAIIKAVGMG